MSHHTTSIPGQLGWAEESRLLRWLGIGRASLLCELGCGPGYVAAHLLRDFPEARVVGIDTDSELLGFARAATGRRARFIHADAGACPLRTGSVDFVLARYLFQHVDDPARVAAEAHRILSPGGAFAVVDVDAALWGMTSPALPDLESTGGRRVGGAPGRLIGRQLHRLLRDAGFADVHLDAVVYHSDAHGLDAFRPHLDPERFAPLVRQGAITPESYERMQRGHEALFAAPDGFALMVGLIASGRAGR